MKKKLLVVLLKTNHYKNSGAHMKYIALFFVFYLKVIPFFAVLEILKRPKWINL